MVLYTHFYTHFLNSFFNTKYQGVMLTRKLLHCYTVYSFFIHIFKLIFYICVQICLYWYDLYTTFFMLLFYTHFTKNSITRITDPLTERLLHCYKYEPREGRMSLLHSYIKKRRNPHWRNVVNNVVKMSQ